jgi:hypothetical protein
MFRTLLKPFVFFFASLGFALLLVAIAWFSFDLEFHRKETLTQSLSTFVSLQPANAYVITSLTNTETFEVLEHHWILENYPVGGTHVTVSLPATYHYYVKPEELSFRLQDRVLSVEAKSLYLLTPVGFDTQQVIQWGEKHWFGRAVQTVLKEVELSVSTQLEKRGQQHFPLARKQAYEALAMNVNRFLVQMKQNDFYDEIVVSFADQINKEGGQDVRQVFRFEETSRFQLPVGEDLIIVP